MAHDIFISYSSKDQKIVEGLSHYLEERGIRCFVAYRDIPKGKVWASVITEAIENCQMMVVVFSKDFNISEQVDREIELCAEEKKPILTFRIQDVQFAGAKKYYLKNLNWIDAFPNPRECFNHLYESIIKLLDIENNHLINDKSTVGHADYQKIEKLSQLKQSETIVQVKRQKQDNVNKNFASYTETLNGVSFDMIAVKGGAFVMGSPLNEINRCDDEAQHKVTLSDFYIGKYTVTQELWEAVMGDNPSKFRGYNLPVETVSWDDCQSFLKRLNQLTGKTYSLPTEAQWEFAARGGTQSKGYVYAGSNTLSNVAWYTDNSGDKTHAVAQKQPNELGLYDMSGNVLEWCHDWYGPYPSTLQLDPTGPAIGSLHIYRGGSFGHYEDGCRVAFRNNTLFLDNDGYDILGFRLALVL